VITYNQKQLRDIAFASAKEWLLTDGEGGFACSTVSFMNTRRQHSLLTISLNPPLRRLTLLNKVDEEIIINGKSFFLGTNRYPNTIFPEGYKLLSKFTFDYFPQATYDLSGCQITKSVLMPKRSNAVFIHYENHSKEVMVLRLLPLVGFRSKDSTRKFGETFLTDELPDGIRIIADMSLPRLYVKLSQIYSTSPESHWYYNFIYPHDSNLDKESGEDLFNMGYWETELEPGKGTTLAASTRDLGEFNYDEIMARYIEAADRIRSSCGLPKKYSYLGNSSFNHIVKNNALRTSTVIDGYPYGGLNIPETLIALDGVSYTSESSNFDREFLHELASNEMNGELPSSVDEDTFHINYDNPLTILYFGFALARIVEKERSSEHARRYLPLLEAGIDIITTGILGQTASAEQVRPGKGSHLINLGTNNSDGVPWSVRNAFINALWYNLLKMVDDTKSVIVSSASYSEIISEIAAAYYGTYFERDGRYKSAAGKDVLNFEMAVPLIVPHSPLDEEEKTKICRLLVSKFSESYGNRDAHKSPRHACNLAAIYLLEASRQLKGCEREVGNMKWFVEKLFGMEDFTNCLDGLPKCGNGTSALAQDISSSLVTAEAIRLIKKLKLR